MNIGFYVTRARRVGRALLIGGMYVGIATGIASLGACGGGGGSDSSSTTTSSSTSTTSGSTTTTSTTATSTATSTIAAAASNVVTVNVEAGESSATPNQPYVSVTVCVPNTSTCDTVDHVLVDSGSVGLRIFSSSLTNSVNALPTIASSSKVLNECAIFLSGYTWGSLRQATVTIGGETAASLPIQVLFDSVAGTAPSACQQKGSQNPISTASDLGANGILGIMGFQQDCGTGCVSNSQSGLYYACTSGTGGTSCSAATAPLTSQVNNPISYFTTDNNGAILEMPVISTSGASTATGALVFGIGTQSNNALGSATTIPTDANYDFIATYNSKAYANSFVDSGSNFLFFTDSSLQKCTSNTSYYCPSSVQTKTAVFTPTSSSATGSYTATFYVGNVDSIVKTAVYAYNDIAATMTSSGYGMDFGMPFLYGKNVFFKIESSAGAADGYVGFISNAS